MAVVITNSGPVQPVQGQTVLVATIVGGPFDAISAYVSGGGGQQLRFSLLATVAGKVTPVAQCDYSGPAPSVLQWQPTGSIKEVSSIADAAGTTFALVVFCPMPGIPSPAPPVVSATLVGCTGADFITSSLASGNPNLPANGSEVQIATIVGPCEVVDVGAFLQGLPACTFRVYANAGAGSVEAIVTTEPTAAGAAGASAILRAFPLPVATEYRLTAAKVTADGVLGPACNASIGGYNESIGGGGGGGVVALAGDVNGPSNTNHVDSLSGPGSGIVTLTSLVEIRQTQGGTLAAPTIENAIVQQPRDPAKAPFFIGLLEAATFNATVDVTQAWGYNANLAVLAEPAIYWRLEQDFEVAPGTHWFEYYIEYFGVNRAMTFRPFYLNVDRATDVGQMLLSLPGPGPASGSIQILGGDGVTNYLQISGLGWFWKNNYPLYIFDSLANQRLFGEITSGDYMVIGDFTVPNSIIYRGGTGGGGLAGQIFEVGPTNWLDIYDSVNAPQFSFKTNIQPGGEVSLHMNGPSPVAAAVPASGWTLYEDPATGNLMAVNAAGNRRTVALA